MKKVLLVLFLVLTLPILSLTVYCKHNYQPIPTSADSGFDSDYGDYDNGGWGGSSGGSWGGSSWDDDDDDYYSSSSGYSGGGSISPEMIPILCIVMFIPIVIPILVSCISSSIKKEKSQQEYFKNALAYEGLHSGDGLNSEDVQSAYRNYVDIQKAWMNRDLAPVRHLLTDEMYNMYQMQVETLIEDNQVNVMSNFEFVCGRVKSKRIINNIETTKILLCVNCKDYIKDVTSGRIVSGDKHAKITYIYELIFIKDLNSNKTINCPTCGAQVKKQMSSICPYCNNLLTLSPTELTMSNKRILKQFKWK